MARLRVDADSSAASDPEIQKLLFTLAAGDSTQMLQVYRDWWKTNHRAACATATAPSFDYSKHLPHALQTGLRDAINAAITGGTRARCVKSLNVLQQSGFWRLSWLDTFGLFGAPIVNNRDFLYRLRSLETSATNRVQVLQGLAEVAGQRRQRILRPWASANVSQKHEWAAYDLTAVIEDLKEHGDDDGQYQEDGNDTTIPIRNKSRNRSGHKKGQGSSARPSGQTEGCETEAEDDDSHEDEPEERWRHQDMEETRRTEETDSTEQTEDDEHDDDDVHDGQDTEDVDDETGMSTDMDFSTEIDIEQARGGRDRVRDESVDDGSRYSFLDLAQTPTRDLPSPSPPPIFDTPRDITPQPAASPSRTRTPSPAPRQTSSPEAALPALAWKPVANPHMHAKRTSSHLSAGDTPLAMAALHKKPKRSRRTKSLIHGPGASPASPALAADASIAAWTELLNLVCDCRVISETADKHRQTLFAGTDPPSSTSPYCALFQPEQVHGQDPTEWQLLFLDFRNKRASTYCPSRPATAANHGERLMKSLNYTVHEIKFNSIRELAPDILETDDNDPDNPENTHVLVAAVAAFLCGDNGPPEQVSPRLWATIFESLQSYSSDAHEDSNLDASTLLRLHDPTECEEIAREEVRNHFVTETSASSAPSALRHLQEAWYMAQEVCSAYDEAERQATLLVAEAQVIRKILKAAGRMSISATSPRNTDLLKKELEQLQTGYTQLDAMQWPPGTSREQYLVNLEVKRQQIKDAEKTPAAQSTIGSAAAQLEAKVCSMIADFGEHKSSYRKAKAVLEAGMSQVVENH